MVSRIKTVGIYHDNDSYDYQQEFSTPFESLNPVKPVTHTHLELNEAVITPDIERLAQSYDTLYDPTTIQTSDDAKLSIKNASLRCTATGREFNVFVRINTRQSNKITKKSCFCKGFLQHIGCSRYENYFQDATGVLHKKVVDFNSFFQL